MASTSFNTNARRFLRAGSRAASRIPAWAASAPQHSCPSGDNNFTTICGCANRCGVKFCKSSLGHAARKKGNPGAPLALGRKCFAQPIIEEIIINAREQLFAFIHAKKFQNAG